MVRVTKGECLDGASVPYTGHLISVLSNSLELLHADCIDYAPGETWTAFDVLAYENGVDPASMFFIQDADTKLQIGILDMDHATGEYLGKTYNQSNGGTLQFVYVSRLSLTTAEYCAIVRGDSPSDLWFIRGIAQNNIVFTK